MICAFHFSMPRQVTILIHQLHLWLKPLRGKKFLKYFCSYLRAAWLQIFIHFFSENHFFHHVSISSGKNSQFARITRIHKAVWSTKRIYTGTWTMLLKVWLQKLFSFHWNTCNNNEQASQFHRNRILADDSTTGNWFLAIYNKRSSLDSLKYFWNFKLRI